MNMKITYNGKTIESNYKVGSNQYVKKSKQVNTYRGGMSLLAFAIIIVGFYDLQLAFHPSKVSAANKSVAEAPLYPLASESANLVAQPEETEITPTPTELESVVAYIARKFEPEGKAVVVRAINCFYSESGLRPTAVGQNKDSHKSKDHGVAQLNDYWHKLTPEMKTDIKANIDKAYEIYKGRSRNGGNGFSAWYGKLCN